MKLFTLLFGVAWGQPMIPLKRVVSESLSPSPQLNSLARDVERVESVREIKDITKSFVQFAQFGRWDDIGLLFDDNGVLLWEDATTAIATGSAAIITWLSSDAGQMDGIRSESVNTLVAECPVVNLDVDGKTAKGRFEGMRFMGDGQGNAKIAGGVYENDYILTEHGWKISRLHYHGLYASPYANGMRTLNKTQPLVPYHFTATETRPIPQYVGLAPEATASAEELAFRIARLNDEDEVRNLQHAYGYYVDRRMWTDIVDLFVNDSSIHLRGNDYAGPAGVRQGLQSQMGPEGLTQGILNDHPIFDTMVEMKPNGVEAVARGIELGMGGNANTREAWWEFSVFRNNFVKNDGVWRFKDMTVIPLMVANYSTGWGKSSIKLPERVMPDFIKPRTRKSRYQGLKEALIDLGDLQRQLNRSLGYDAVENLSGAYGYYADDQRCDYGTLHAQNGHKLSPFTGWYHGTERVTKSCHETYSSGVNPNPQRAGITFHWRPQPVINVSRDARSANSRTRLYQPSCSAANTSAGGWNGAIYHDQMVLDPEDGGKWKLWSITIDEHYFTSSWAGGWAAANPRPKTASQPGATALSQKFPPDVTVAQVGERESTFMGGSGRYIAWPEIQRMWFAYRNPVSGRVPEWYWPGCVPCKYKPEWNLTNHGYQEPPNGPVPLG